jgi:hypothetical protein
MCSGNTLDLYSEGAWFESLTTPAILTELFRCFLQSLQANAAIGYRLDHDRFLPNFFLIHNSLFIVPLNAVQSGCLPRREITP